MYSFKKACFSAKLLFSQFEIILGTSEGVVLINAWERTKSNCSRYKDNLAITDYPLEVFFMESINRSSAATT